MTSHYEDLLAIVQSLGRPATDDDRDIAWCGANVPVGVARTPNGMIELFLAGPELEARYPRVREALEFQKWFRNSGSELLANRILLPAAGHFEQVAAFLCTELLRSGAESDLPHAFKRTEPLIDLAIDSLLLADDSFIGLCGEVLLLDALLRESPIARHREVIESWKGHRDTARDFQMPWVGVEVKTTTQSTSSHEFSGIHQFEPGHGVDGAVETAFFVVSLGLEWSDDEANSRSIPDLVTRLVAYADAVLGQSGSDRLLDHIAAYGGPTSVGYDHRTIADSARFGRRFRLKFVRCYDMTDPVIRLLSTDDLRARPFIDAAGLRLRVNFPDHVTGDINPVVGLSNAARLLLNLST